MFDAVAATLRKQRETATRAAEDGTEAVAGTVETTLDAATEIASGTMGIAQTARRPFSPTSSLKRCGRSWRACQVGQRGQQRHEVGSVLRVSEATDRPLALSGDAGWSGLTVGGAGGLAGELGNNGKSCNEALPFSLSPRPSFCAFACSGWTSLCSGGLPRCLGIRLAPKTKPPRQLGPLLAVVRGGHRVVGG